MEKLIDVLEESKKIIRANHETDFKEIKRKDKQRIFDLFYDLNADNLTDADSDGASFIINTTNDTSFIFNSYAEYSYINDIRKCLTYCYFYNNEGEEFSLNIENIPKIIDFIKGTENEVIGILNTSILTTAGDYTLQDITLQDAKKIADNACIDSAIGHQATSDIVSTLLDQDIPMNRQLFEQEVGQRCIVFKLLGRPEEGKILTLDEIKKIGYKFQLLERKA